MNILKITSGITVICGIVASKVLVKTIVLYFTSAVWLTFLMTAIWPFVVSGLLLYGPEEMKQCLPFYTACWAWCAVSIVVLYKRRLVQTAAEVF